MPGDPLRGASEAWSCRLSAPAAACLETAGREAAADGAAEVGAHHQLIGLFHEGVAAAVLEELGVRAEAVRAAARELFPGGGPVGERLPPESAEARQTVQRAAEFARQAGRDDVGTEHLLAALALDPGSRARHVLSHLGVSVAAINKELGCYGGTGKRRRRKQGKAELACSFCGKSQKQVRKLVAGPGASICDECIDAFVTA